MRFLQWAGRMLLLYLAVVGISVLLASWVFGLGTAQGQMAVIFGAVAGLPGAFKLARSF
jgi:hypothetical protein